MGNYELVTIKKGEIKTVDAFIKNFNAIGANMKALSVSAYMFLTSDDVETKKEFKLRVLDELKMSNSTLTFLKTAGFLYILDDVFNNFAYTNVIYFKKAIDYFNTKSDIKNNIQLWSDDCKGQQETVHKSIIRMLDEIALMHNSYIDHNEDDIINELKKLSQKELKSLIDKYVSHNTTDEVTEDEIADEVTEDETTDDIIDDNSSDFEETLSHMVSITLTDEEYNSLITLIDDTLSNNKRTKGTLEYALKEVKEIISRSI